MPKYVWEYGFQDFTQGCINILEVVVKMELSRTQGMLFACLSFNHIMRVMEDPNCEIRKQD